MNKTTQEHLTTDFNLIKKEYEKYYEELMHKGFFPFGSTDSGYFGPSNLDDLFYVFKKINLSKYKNFVDLGSGDGGVVLAASLFTNAYGFELDKELFNKSIEIKNKLAKKIKFNKIKILNKNYLNETLSKYDVFYHYPDKPVYQIENKLLKEIKPKAILIHYGNHFSPLQLKKFKEFDFDGMKVSLYRK